MIPLQPRTNPTYEQVIEALRHHAEFCVSRAKSYGDLRLACRVWYAKALESSMVVITSRPELVQEILERMLLLYEFCLAEVVRREYVSAFHAEDEKRRTNAASKIIQPFIKGVVS